MADDAGRDPSVELFDVRLDDISLTELFADIKHEAKLPVHGNEVEFMRHPRTPSQGRRIHYLPIGLHRDYLKGKPLVVQSKLSILLLAWEVYTYECQKSSVAMEDWHDSVRVIIVTSYIRARRLPQLSYGL